MEGPFKYRAFISYSHADTKWATWLHRSLESYRVPKPLVGTEGKDGPVPSTLFPIYRDRDEFAASADLNESVNQGLESSGHLIVVCSPNAVQSRWVNAEILAFKRLGGENRILALIVGGEPNASNAAGSGAGLECLPELLKQRWSTDGSRSGEELEPVAADVRIGGDGKENAKLKLAAGILGVAYNDLKHREIEAARRRTRFFQAVAATMTVLAFLAVGFGTLSYYYLQRSETMTEEAIDIASGFVNRIVALSGRLGVSQATINGFLIAADTQLSGLYQRGVRTPALDHQRAKVLMLFADYFAATGDTARELARAKGAVTLMRGLAHRFPADSDDAADLAIAEKKVGDVQRAQGHHGAALDAYRSGLAIWRTLSARNGPKDDWTRQEARAQSQIGYVLELQGDLARAREAFEGALALRQRLLAKHPGSLDDQHAIAAENSNIGDVLQKGGKVQEALASYGRSASVFRRITGLDPGNAQWRFELSSVEQEIGDALATEGTLEPAIDAFRQSLSQRQSLVAFDAHNTGWLQSIGWSNVRIGDVLAEQGKTGQALEAYRAALDSSSRLARTDPKNAVWQRDLYISEERVGLTLQQAHDLAAARAALRDTLAITKRLSADSPANGLATIDFANCQDDLGELELAARAYADAIPYFRAAGLTLSRLPAAVFANVDATNNLARSEDGQGEALRGEGRWAEAESFLTLGLSVRERMRSSDPTDATLLHDAAITEENLAIVQAHLDRWADAQGHVLRAQLQLKYAIQRSETQSPWRADLARVTGEANDIRLHRAP